MIQILVPFGLVFFLGIYLILIDLFKLPTKRTIKAILSLDKREKKKTRNFDVFVNSLSMRFSKVIKLTDYKKRKLTATLRSAGIKLSPETFIVKSWVKAGMMLLFIIPAFLLWLTTAK